MTQQTCPKLQQMFNQTNKNKSKKSNLTKKPSYHFDEKLPSGEISYLFALLLRHIRISIEYKSIS